ncbi:MAG: DUF3891 family protein [Cyclobacteriaceae bacterium]
MIVNYTQKGWRIVSQCSHGILAAQICAFWKKENQPDRWVETLIATAEHDDANNEIEKPDLLEENGGPRNFKMEAFDKKYCEKLLNSAMIKSCYVGLLISRHIQFLYGEDPSAKSFCDQLKNKEKLWMKAIQVTTKEIDDSYSLLEFCDAFSLLICQDLVQAENRKIEISTGPDKKSYQLYSEKDQELIVSPWPFEVSTFNVNYEYRELEQLSFKNTAEFRSAFLAAPLIWNKLRISKPPNRQLK